MSLGTAEPPSWNTVVGPIPCPGTAKEGRELAPWPGLVVVLEVEVVTQIPQQTVGYQRCGHEELFPIPPVRRGVRTGAWVEMVFRAHVLCFECLDHADRGDVTETKLKTAAPAGLE